MSRPGDDQHDPDARPPSFEDFVADRWATLYRSAYLLTGSPDGGADLLQDTLVKAYRRWDRVARTTTPEAYVRRMLQNEFVDQQRVRARRRKKTALVGVPAWAAPATVPGSTPSPVDRLDMWEALATLSPRQRQVLVLRYYEDLSEVEIARTLGISTGSVKSYAHSALRSLRARSGSTADATDTTDREVPR